MSDATEIELIHNVGARIRDQPAPIEPVRRTHKAVARPRAGRKPASKR